MTNQNKLIITGLVDQFGAVEVIDVIRRHLSDRGHSLNPADNNAEAYRIQADILASIRPGLLVEQERIDSAKPVAAASAT
jgi:hypothetical protein